MRRHITLLAALAALAFVPACRLAEAATYGNQIGSGSSSSSSAGITDGITLLGAGSSGDKYRANPAAALTPDAHGYFSALFQQRTGLSPLAFVTVDDEFTDTNKQFTGANGRAFFNSGTGTEAYVAALGSGLIRVTGANGSGGFADWTLSAATSLLTNARTKRWMLAYRVAISAAPGSGSRLAFGMYIGTSMVGLGFGSAAANWKYCRGVNAITELVDTGKAIDSSGSQYLWVYLYNDGTNVRYDMDVLGGAAEAIAESSANLPSTTGYPYIWNEGTNSDQYIYDAYVFMMER